ncbi:MAG: hypothetical protein QW255_05010 [Candidatus Bilamarchaeaceae archaeon]
MRIFKLDPTTLEQIYVGTVTGFYKYDATAFYTAGDIVYNDTTGDILVCIKDIPTTPAEKFFFDPEYFRPFWYLYAIRDLSTYISSITPSDAERPVLKRVFDAVMERKFGVGVLIADKNLHGSGLDLNEITHTGRYLILIDDITAIKNIPVWLVYSDTVILDNEPKNFASTVIGLDVFSFASINNNSLSSTFGLVQVLFSNNNNRVSIAVRKYVGNNSMSFRWSEWKVLRTGFNVNLIQNYLETHRNIVESLYDASHKQSLMVETNYEINNNDIIINIDGYHHSIFRNITAVFMIAKDIERDIMISDHFPIPFTDQNYKIKYNRHNINVEISNDKKSIILKNMTNILEVRKILLIT